MTFRNEVWGRPASAIFDIGPDLWVAFANVGFIRMDLDEMARATIDSSHALRYDVFNPAYGAAYPDIATGGSSVVRSGNDHLSFVTGRGVGLVRLSDLAQQSTTPRPPVIEGVTANDRRYPSTAAVLPPRTNRLRIDYTVVNVSSPGNRVRFRYRLDGFDTNWVDGTLPRQAVYANLQPGDYRFRLQASTNAGTWNGAETEWAFTIEPMFYQTAAFRAVVALVLILLGIAAWRLWMRHVRKELAGVFAERLRLSREIHDTLLQTLVGLTLDLTAMSRRVAAQSVQTQLITMRRQVEECIREVRQSIWDLRSPALDRHGLVGALRAASEELTSGKVRFTLTVTGSPRPCPSHIETHVLRIGHEAVTNAVRHAQARQVQVEIGFEDRLLRLRIVDDGRGLRDDETIPGAGHYGLATMQERAADVGGRCWIESAPGAGLQVIAEFPLAPAR
ncbi:MAG: hypothetical protein HYX77_09525 [Acidobacteria bacterium]|nr:hypothetical protein [Acidobacteriota bacterium]